MLKAGYGGKGHCFYGVKWPGYQSVINHVTGKPSGLLILFAHLYTPGMEQARLRPAACLRSALPLPLAHACCLAVQAEPAEGGTEGTKDERPLTERENLIIEVAELWKEAKHSLRPTARTRRARIRRRLRRLASSCRTRRCP